MTATLRRLASLPLAALLVVSAACSDAASFTAPDADLAGPAFAKAGGNDNSSRIVSQTTIGDTTITVFTVGTNDNQSATFQLGNDSKISFPFAAASICDLKTSSYGANTWNKSCTPSAAAVTITAKAWTNKEGQAVSDFQPAMRFVPGAKKSVQLFLKYSAATPARIDFRMPDGTLVNEALTDASLVSVIDASNGKISRIIKHFSGYTVAAD